MRANIFFFLNLFLDKTTNLKVTVLDENDNIPQLKLSKYTFAIAEEQIDDTVVGNVEASDLDIGTNAEIIYTLERGHIVGGVAR